MIASRGKSDSPPPMSLLRSGVKSAVAAAMGSLEQPGAFDIRSKDSSSLFPGGSRIAPVRVEILRNYPTRQVRSRVLLKLGGPNRLKGLGEAFPELGGRFSSPSCSRWRGTPFSLQPGSGYPSCDGNRRKARRASVDAIKQPAGGLPGKKIGISFQGR